MATKKELEAKLSIKKQRAALMLIEQQLGDDLGKGRTQDEIAEEVGITRMTLYRWRTQDDTFIEYMNTLAKDFLRAEQGNVFRQLMRSINSSQPSIKGIELFMKLQGLLKEHSIVELKENEERSDESVKKSLEEIDALLTDDESIE